VFVNSSPISEFKPEIGLRQGYPLVPFLFLIIVKWLSIDVMEANRKGILEGLKIGNNQVNISRL